MFAPAGSGRNVLQGISATCQVDSKGVFQANEEEESAPHLVHGEGPQALALKKEKTFSNLPRGKRNPVMLHLTQPSWSHCQAPMSPESH